MRLADIFACMLYRLRKISERYFCFTGLLWLGLGMLVWGCVGEPVKPSADAFMTAHQESGAIWEVCQRELKGRQFRLDRVDKRSGIIETYPLVSKQWFEFWRNDVVDSYSQSESNLHTVRRKVILKVKSQTSEGHRIQCQVKVERLSSHKIVLTGTARARKIFSYRITEQNRKKMQWIPLGRDFALEKSIVASIEKSIDRKK